jgi:hypothetical protein
MSGIWTWLSSVAGWMTGVIDQVTAAGWSAVAATFSATSSLMMWRIHRRNLLESFRPGLVLDDWHREFGPGAYVRTDTVSFRKIKNLGRGAALNVVIDVPWNAEFALVRLPMIGSGESVTVDGSMRFKWTAEDTGMPAIYIEISCFDLYDRRWRTTYTLKPAPIRISEEIPFVTGEKVHDLTDRFEFDGVARELASGVELYSVETSKPESKFRRRIRQRWARLRGRPDFIDQQDPHWLSFRRLFRRR